MWHLEVHVLVDLVLGYNPEPKWYAHVGVYDSLPEAGWLIESVRQQVLQVVLNLTFVFGKDPVDKDLYENAMGFWGRDFAQQTDKTNNCAFHCNLLLIAVSIGASPSQITAKLGEFARDIHQMAFKSAANRNFTALIDAQQALKIVLLLQPPSAMALFLLPRAPH